MGNGILGMEDLVINETPNFNLVDIMYDKATGAGRSNPRNTLKL